MKSLLLVLALCSPYALAAETAANDAQVRDLLRRLKEVTAEADALWQYVGSGIENPDMNAFYRADRLREHRRARH